jgi:cell wall-associated NlpC family hydrolase
VGGKGVWIVAVVAGPFALILFLVFLLGGGGSSASSSAAGLTAALVGGAPLNASAIPNQAWVPWIEKAGALCSTFPAPVIAAQIDDESGWNPTAVSPKGAEGLSQFEPGTWPAYSADDAGDGNVSPFNPIDAIMAQGRYDCALAAAVAKIAAATGIPVLTLALDGYNAGLGAVIAANGIPAIPETQAYAPRIEALAATYTSATPVLTDSSFASAEIAAAVAEVGVPYVWAGGSDIGPTTGDGAGGDGFDCSGLVMYAVFQASNGAIQLPHSSEIDATLGTDVATGLGSQVLGSGLLQPGDVIAFQLDPDDYSHIGIYLGNGDMVVAPQTGETVDIENLNMPYWLGVEWSARRYAS